MSGVIDQALFAQMVAIDELARLIRSQSVPFKHPIWAELVEPEPEGKEAAPVPDECVPTRHCHCSEGRCLVMIPVKGQSLVIASQPKGRTEVEKKPKEDQTEH